MACCQFVPTHDLEPGEPCQLLAFVLGEQGMGDGHCVRGGVFALTVEVKGGEEKPQEVWSDIGQHVIEMQPDRTTQSIVHPNGGLCDGSR